jgi:hypothetical protein
MYYLLNGQFDAAEWAQNGQFSRRLSRLQGVRLVEVPGCWALAGAARQVGVGRAAWQ